jgi:hypothetical protein
MTENVLKKTEKKRLKKNPEKKVLKNPKANHI